MPPPRVRRRRQRRRRARKTPSRPPRCSSWRISIVFASMCGSTPLPARARLRRG